MFGVGLQFSELWLGMIGAIGGGRGLDNDGDDLGVLCPHCMMDRLCHRFGRTGEQGYLLGVCDGEI